MRMQVGVGLWCLQASVLQPRPFPALYADLLDDARWAETVGLDSLWLSEHHFFYDGYCPAVLTAAGGMLAVTDRLRVGTGVLLLPLHTSRRVAAAAADLTASSGGRFDLGVGAGYRAVEYEGRGLAFGDRLPRMVAGLDTITGPAAGGAPVWVGVSSPAAARRAGRRCLGLFLSGAFPLPVVANLVGEHRRAFAQHHPEAGHPPPVGLLRNVWLADARADQERARTWARSSYVVYAGLGWSAADAGMDFSASAEASMREVGEGAYIGPAHVVAEQLAPYSELGVDVVVCRVGYDLPPRAAVLEVMERLGRELRPLLVGAEGVL